ncbi:hypothetical protein BRD07_07770 [Halobacteriales archaeon QS_9_68_42]|nr:MAG: hypothetical protein BRD07_07770 [Halobacteriales archaeon QS_9_68_42]
MTPERGLTLALVAALSLALLAGVAVPNGDGVVAASHGPEDGNYTVVPLDDRSPGATDVRYGQRVVAGAGVDLETLEETTATYEAGSWNSCGPDNGETFGIDRGNTMSGYEVDHSLEENVKSFSAGEDLFRVEYYGEDDFGSSTYLDDGDEFISVANCIDNPDEPGWYRISGTTTGVTESGKRATYSSDSHYFWICECGDEAEAREKLGPPPSEPRETATPTPTPAEAAETTPDNGDDTADEGGSRPPESTPTPTPAEASGSAVTDSATPDPTATVGDADDAADEAMATPPDPTPTGGWDDEVLNTPTSAGGPGFGPVAAVLALVGALLVLGWRR